MNLFKVAYTLMNVFFFNIISFFMLVLQMYLLSLQDMNLTRLSSRKLINRTHLFINRNPILNLSSFMPLPKKKGQPESCPLSVILALFF